MHSVSHHFLILIFEVLQQLAHQNFVGLPVFYHTNNISKSKPLSHMLSQRQPYSIFNKIYGFLIMIISRIK